MASPMRKKRAWSTREDDAESKETAAFEATVAAAKDTAAKSGAFLSTAKEDLTDHRRWLQAQTVAVERDRARHDRWLQRQRDHRLAIARRERTKRRRQLVRQRAVRAMQQAAWAAMLFVRSLFLLAIATTVAGIKYVATLIARGVAYTGAGLGALARSIGRLIAGGAGWTGAKLKAFVLWLGRMLSASAVWCGARARASATAGGRALATSSAFVAAKAQSPARVGGSALAAGSSAVGSKAGMLGRSMGRSLGSGLSLASAQGSALAGATGRSAARGFAVVANKASALAAASKRGLAAGFSWSRVRMAALAPALYVGIAKLGRQAERSARAGAVRADGMFASARAAAAAARGAAPIAEAEIYGPHGDGVDLTGHPANDPGTHGDTPEALGTEVYGPFYEGFWVDGVSPNEPQMPPATLAPRVRTENALSLWARNAGARSYSWAQSSWAQSSWVQSSWARTRDAEPSQMMIIAGAVLLVCGGLLLGGGLFLRAGAGTTPQVVEDAHQGIAWTFEASDRPLPERAVFTLSGTPESFRINGLSLSGTNQSDQPLTAVRAILKPDVQRPDLKLTLQVDRPAVPAGAGDTAAQALDIVPENTVPPHAAFRLVFPFPPEAMDGADGIAVEEFFESYGGLLLKLHYESGDKQRSVIQYLPPELLKAQLDEVTAGGGS